MLEVLFPTDTPETIREKLRFKKLTMQYKIYKFADLAGQMTYQTILATGLVIQPPASTLFTICVKYLRQRL